MDVLGLYVPELLGSVVFLGLALTVVIILVVKWAAHGFRVTASNKKLVWYTLIFGGLSVLMAVGGIALLVDSIERDEGGKRADVNRHVVVDGRRLA